LISSGSTFNILSMHDLSLDLKKKILNDPLNRTVFSVSREVYLVGGYIRDLLARGIRSKDLDFVTPRALKPLAESVSKALGGRVVELKEEQTIRVCLRDGMLDFSRLYSPIEEDLRGRDFTINAMAWSPGSGLLDPLGGLSDIRQGVIRGISKKNFEHDPVRLLRAYRFSGELSWPIERRTRRVIKTMPERIKHSASERITLELFKLLNSEDPSAALGTALRDGLLALIISLSYKKLYENIKSVSKVRKNLEKLPERYHFRELSQGLSHEGLLRLEGLLLGSDIEGSLLCMSRSTLKRVQTVQALYARYLGIGRLQRGEVFDLFDEAGEALLDLLVLTGNTGCLKDAERFMRISRKGIMSSEEIMKTTGLGPGPRLGELIREMKRLQFEGTIRSRAQAVRRLKKPTGHTA
jgi:tRNA nucleotidyltransferase (CCA-adding enzyme)